MLANIGNSGKRNNDCVLFIDTLRFLCFLLGNKKNNV